MQVLAVASEIFPLIKTGGLADVTGALPAALAPHGIIVRTLVPGYPKVLEALANRRTVAQIDDLFGAPAALLSGKAAGLELFVLDAPELFARPGGPYADPSGHDYGDNWRRFAALGWVGARLARGEFKGYRADLLHAHDWQAGLAPAYLAYGPAHAVKSVMTVHNLAFQGQFGAEIFGQLGFPADAFSVDGLEYYGGVGYLKAGLKLADAVTTVSPSYALEIRDGEFGMGLDGLLRTRTDTLHGILNGIDVEAWDPGTDPALVQTYRAGTVHLRAVNKAALRERFGLEDDDSPLFGVISRLTWQKGMDLLLPAIGELVGMGAQLVVLGSGDPGIEGGMHHAASAHRGRVGVQIGYDEALSHLIQGGADALLVPSRFEPCGLTQLYALRYGCVPVVARVGGLADTVIDANEAAMQAGVATGVQFHPVTQATLTDAIRRAIQLYRRPKAWKKLQRKGMKTDVSWAQSGLRYADLFRHLTGLEGRDDD